jgi:hypothetical protein
VDSTIQKIRGIEGSSVDLVVRRDGASIELEVPRRIVRR